MDLKAYLERIGLTAPEPPSLSALRELHNHHLLSIPFESLSIHIGEKIILDPALIFNKIVLRRRGGFCYENNGLFLWVLQELGYNPKVLSGRVQTRMPGIYGPTFDHLILTVELEGRRWLCDVGFGEGIRFPFPLEDRWEEEQEGCIFRLRVDGEEWHLEKRENEGWRSLFKFTLEERRFKDFQGMCEFHQTSPYSFFVCKTFCSLQLPRGRVTYMGHRLIKTEFTSGEDRVKNTQILTEEEIPNVLKETFGIVLNGKLEIKDEDHLLPPTE
ncbi:arylamine N-acetyltransferase 2 [Bombina bombina]|uniref:arylamine N-acetyltransferase 2 n=1 Tax=Bombina bombina TaxID=8345 RepID=UPI00235A8B9E|nr:arylamine N-acetyltransferase 2 [Bombina bombina]